MRPGHRTLWICLIACLSVFPVLSACTSASGPAATVTAVMTQPAAPSATAAFTATTALTATVAPTATAELVSTPTPAAVQFDSERAFKDLEYQMALGPRLPESPAHAQVVDWMKQSLESSGWVVEIQETTRMGHPVRNVIAKRGNQGRWTIIGAHFDSRLKADQDPDISKRGDPVPAANDGASGVAVLLELARVLPVDKNQQVWLAFFDAEDQGDLPGWDWLLGSRVLAESLTTHPDAVVVIDMIGDADLNIYQERNSNPQITQEIWQSAASLGYEQQFIPSPKWNMLDDHTPFLEKGIPAIDIIDFDYPYWHTTGDTTDKTSAHSLKVIGDTLIHWLAQGIEK